MTSYGTSVSLDLTLGGTITATKFTITAYPSQDFYNQYITDTPFVACFVMVAALVFALIVFGLYDYMVRRHDDGSRFIHYVLSFICHVALNTSYPFHLLLPCLPPASSHVMCSILSSPLHTFPMSHSI